MKILVIPLDTQVAEEYECDDFEFRANQVSNWLRLKKDGKEIFFCKRIATFKLLK